MGRSKLHCVGCPPLPEPPRQVTRHDYTVAAITYKKPDITRYDAMIRPMLAWKHPKRMSREDWLMLVPMPLMCTPKIDGIRCITQNDNVLMPGTSCWPTTRSLKDIPNEHIRRRISMECPPFLDGELTVGETFQASTSGIMSYDGRPEFTYWVFDSNINLWHLPYEKRIDLLRQMKQDGKLPDFVRVLDPVLVKNDEELEAYEERCIFQGAEGACGRPPDSPYYHKRSHKTRPYLIAFKRFVDAEALCVGLEPMYTNENEPTRNALGYQERSTHQANMRALPMVGALICRDLVTNVEFKVGTGMDMATREYWHKNPGLCLGSIVKYKYQAHGVKDKPRIPVFIGFRDPADMDDNEAVLLAMQEYQQKTLNL